MSGFNNVGKLMHLPLADIDYEKSISETNFIVSAAAEILSETGGRNWIPLIVKEISDYQYQVVCNHFVYAVAQKAALERVWCIVIEANEKNIEQAKILAREIVPKVNLSTASRAAILAALQYLITEPGSPLKGIDAEVFANKIANSDREKWLDFNPITTLKCGITKGKKLDALSQVFFLQPPKPSVPIPTAPETINIKRASRDEILARLSYLSNYNIDGFEKVNVDMATDVIFTASKGKWKSLNPIAKLDCGIDSTKVKTLKKVFSLS
ncbi:MAG TPA: hypothetical protein V6D28_12885 [Leptolyngbyaceae cyanobacterium]